MYPHQSLLNSINFEFGAFVFSGVYYYMYIENETHQHTRNKTNMQAHIAIIFKREINLGADLELKDVVLVVAKNSIK